MFVSTRYDEKIRTELLVVTKDRTCRRARKRDCVPARFTATIDDTEHRIPFLALGKRI